MKRMYTILLLILNLVFITACTSNKEKLYELTINDNEAIVATFKERSLKYETYRENIIYVYGTKQELKYLYKHPNVSSVRDITGHFLIDQGFPSELNDKDKNN